MMQKFEPEYKDKKFKSEKSFEGWLRKLTVKVISFHDEGQDLLRVWIDEGGEILHCNLQSTIWNGKIVDLDVLQVDKDLPLMEPEKALTRFYKFRVKSIEDTVIV